MVDFLPARVSTTWFYIEATGSVISDFLVAEGYSTGSSQQKEVLSWIGSSSKMPALPSEEASQFYTLVPGSRGIYYSAITNTLSNKLWIVAMRY